MIKIESDSANQRVFIKVKGSKKAVQNGIRRGFYLLGKDLVKTAKQGIINPPKTGRNYNGHIASSAGEYPANQRPARRRRLGLSTANSARLAFSLGFTVQGYLLMHFGSKVPHGKYMQDGYTTKNGVFVEARPFLTLSVDANERNAIKIFESEIGKRL